ncbi:MAG: SDR family oxidoreductase [Labilithrix sp.]
MKGLVLGGTGVIGSAVVRGLRARGVETTFTWHGNEARAKELGGAAVQVDLTRADFADRLFDTTFDILVHCAAVHPLAPLADLTAADFDVPVALAGRATFLAIRAFSRRLIAEKKPGHVVLVGALERAQSLPLSAPFAAAQGMLGPLAMSFSKELGPHRILVNLVAGGLVGDGVSRVLGPSDVESYKKLSALHRLGTAEEIAAPVLFLALDNRYMTGKTLAANGGI